MGGRGAFAIEFIPEFTAIAAPKMARAGAEVLAPMVRKKIHATTGQDATGSLFRSVSVSHSFIRDNGTRFFANVYFEGYDARGMRQGEKAAYMQHGTGKSSPRRRMAQNGKMVSTGSTPRTNFAGRAENSARAQVIAAMQAVLERELRGEM
jgi:hypothetical protein